MFALGASQYIEYDGYWHVFIAQQDRWSNFWEDIRVNAHPPLFFLLLKLLLHLGRSRLIYRAISLVTGILSVFSVGWIARKIMRSDFWAWTTALAYGLAMPTIIIACEVRSYMLSALLVLISFSCLLELDSPRDRKHEIVARTWFAVAAILACLSHYYAFFYAGVAAILLLGRSVVRQFRGERAGWIAELSTVVPMLGAIATLYITHASLKAEIQGHLVPYYYAPAGAESIPYFLMRNWKNLLNLFLPFEVIGDVPALVLLALAGAGAVMLFIGRSVRFRWTIFITGGMLFVIVLTAVAGKYPFGGDLRQQFILFPFSVLCAFAFADRLTAAIPPRGRSIVIAVAAFAVIGVSALRFRQYPKTSEEILADREKIFEGLEPDPAAVYVDQFNLITFFTFHHNWQWSSLAAQPVPGIAIYKVHRGARQMLVFRDTQEWNVRPDFTDLYPKLAEALRAEKISEIAVFGDVQSTPEQPFSASRSLRHEVAMRAAASNLCVERLRIDAAGWFGAFRESGCDAPELKPPRVTGTFDDSSDEIEYSGVWNHGHWIPASGGTSSVSNLPGSSARLTFDGTEITWVYAKAFDRGIASVKIDRMPRDDVNQFSPKIVWQASTTFRGLPPGRHVFEVMVSGKKAPEATDRFIDLDALVVR